MKVTLLYFAGLRDLVAQEREEFVLPEDVATVMDFLAHLEGTKGALTGRLGSVRVAMDEEFVPADTKLVPGCVLALIPPVSGG